jgi:hypothetical protein
MPPASLSLREKAPYTTADRQASIHHGKQGRHAVNPVVDAFAAIFYQYYGESGNVPCLTVGF